MRRDPPDPVKRQLRQEVGFGCPFPDCRKPMLTFHHLDPPWRVEEHHRPEGIIALCKDHASSAALACSRATNCEHSRRRAGTPAK
jgi:hypothetical protein